MTPPAAKPKTGVGDTRELEAVITRAFAEYAKSQSAPATVVQKRAPNYWHFIISGLVTVIITVGGSMIQQSSANSARDVKIEDLSRRITGLEQNTASKSDVEALRNYLTSTLSQIQADVKELRAHEDTRR